MNTTSNRSNSKSKFALAVEARPRRAYEFDVGGFFGLGGLPIHKIAIRVAVKSEEDVAIVSAYDYLTKAGATADSGARTDADILNDAKAIEVLFRCCQRAEPGDPAKNVPSDEAQGYRYSAFPGPEWMRNNLTTDQLATILNLVNEVRVKEGPLKLDIDLATVRALAQGCDALADTDTPDVLLAPCSREWLAQAFVLLAIEWMAEVNRADAREGDGGARSVDGDAAGPGGGDLPGGVRDGGGGGAGDARLPEQDGAAGGVNPGGSAAGG